MASTRLEGGSSNSLGSEATGRGSRSLALGDWVRVTESLSNSEKLSSDSKDGDGGGGTSSSSDESSLSILKLVAGAVSGRGGSLDFARRSD